MFSFQHTINIKIINEMFYALLSILGDQNLAYILLIAHCNSD